jgi:Spy/CpxP family protein refolding chaperone
MTVMENVLIVYFGYYSPFVLKKILRFTNVNTPLTPDSHPCFIIPVSKIYNKGSTMKTQKLLLVLVGLSAASIVTAGVHSGYGDRHERHGMHRDHSQINSEHHRHGQGLLRRLDRALDLRPEQHEAIRKILREDRKARRAAMSTHADRHGRGRVPLSDLDPKSFMSVDHFDKTAFLDALERRAAERKAERKTARRARLERRAALMERIFAILTPEQRAKWIELSH